MDVQLLSTQHSVQRLGVVMDRGTTSQGQELPPTSDSSSLGICPRTAIQSGDQEGKASEVSRSSVLCSQKGHRQEESSPGPVRSELLYQMRQVPDADYFTGTNPTTPWGLHHLHRSYRRLLAYSDRSTPYPPTLASNWEIRLMPSELCPSG